MAAVLWVVIAIIGVLEAHAVFNTIDRALADRIIDIGWANPAWARAVTHVGSTTPMIILNVCAMALTALLARTERVRAALFIGSAPLIATIATSIGKQSVQRIRPDLLVDGPQVGGWSWPSGHSSGTMALALALSWMIMATWNRPRAWAWGVAAALISCSLIIGVTRVLIGVHWPSDVLSGWLTGLAAVVTALLLMQSFSRRSAEAGSVRKQEQVEP